MALDASREVVGTQVRDGDGIVMDDDELVTEGNCMHEGGCVSENFGDDARDDCAMPPGADTWDDPGNEPTL